MPAARDSVRSICANSVARVSLKVSHAPDLISASSTRRFTVRMSTRSHMSMSDLNSPPLLRASSKLCTATSPDALDRRHAEANHLSRRAPARTTTWLSFTSGGSTSMPIERASAMNNPSFAVSLMSFVIIALMNSTG